MMNEYVDTEEKNEEVLSAIDAARNKINSKIQQLISLR